MGVTQTIGARALRVGIRKTTGLCVLLLGWWPLCLVQAQTGYVTQEAPRSSARWYDGLEDWLMQELALGLTWWHVVAASAALVLAAIVHVILNRWIRRRRRLEATGPELGTGDMPDKEAESWTNLVVGAALPPLETFVWGLGAYLALFFLLTPLRISAEPGWVFILVSWMRKLFVVVLLFWFLYRVIRDVEKRLRQWSEQTRSGWDAILVSLIARALRLVFPLIAFVLSLPLLPIESESHRFIENGLSVLLIVSISIILVQLVRALEEALKQEFRIDVADNLRARKLHTQVSVLRKVAIVVIGVFTLASVLMIFEPVRQFGTSILASAGIAGIILGMAAQRSLGSLLAGFQIAMTQPIRLDDVVIVEGEWGRIEEITLTYVVVMIWDLRRLVLPIQYFIEKPFQNWTRTSAEILGSVFLRTDYTVPVDALRNELTRILQSNPKWDGKVQVLQVTEAHENTLELRALMSASDASSAWDLRCDVRERLITYLQKNHPESLPRFRTELLDDAEDEIE